MHASAAFVLAVTGFAAAQSTSSVLPVSGCGNSIDLIIQSCLGTTQLQYNACTPNDWGCLCEQANNVLTCYNNCPSAPQRFGFEQIKVANCNAASAYPSSSSHAATATAMTATGTMTSMSATATMTPSSTTDNETQTSGTRSSTAATASASQGSGAANVAVPAGLAAIFGLLAFL